MDYSNNDKNFNEIIAELEDDFPFENYLQTGLASYRTVFDIVSRYLNPGQSLFDFGAGPCDKTAVAQRLGVQCSVWDDYSDAWYLREDNRAKIEAFAKSRDIELLAEFPTSLESDSFDMIMLNDVLEHIHDSPRDILNGLLSGLKEGGYLFVTVPNLANIRKRLSVLRGRTNLPAFDLYYWYQGPWRGPVREYVRGDMVSLCANLGLEQTQLGTVHHMLGNLPPIAQPLYKAATRVFPDWKDRWVLVARKPQGWQARTHISDKEFATIYGAKSRGSLHQ